MPVEKVREILRVAQEPVSLETPIGEEEDSHLGDFIPDDDALAPADAASMLLLKNSSVRFSKHLPHVKKRCFRFVSDLRTDIREHLRKSARNLM